MQDLAGLCENELIVKILICEDDLITLRALEYSLKREGYDTIRAEDGLEGSELLKKHSGEIDLMITDQHMPYYSGLELVHLVRNEMNAGFPIIMLTRVNLDSTRKLALSLGVTEHITKPFLPSQLISRVKSILSNGHNDSIDWSL